MQSNPHPNSADQAEAAHGPETAEQTLEGARGAATTPEVATRATSAPHGAAETEATPGEPFVPRTEREYWVDIAAALNAATAGGMPVGIDLDGTLTDHRAWSVVWDRAAEQWTVAGYEDGDEAQAAEPDVEDLAAADNPTRLRWGLNDVMWGDDDSVIVLLSDEDRRPYWLELEPDRAVVLRQDLAGPDREEAHVVADGSDDPEHVDDCPGCETAGLEQAAVHARSALAALCYDLEDPGSNALGALYLLQQATLYVDAPRDDTALALARAEAKVMRRCADFVRDTYSGDETADAADTLERDADIHERGCPAAVGEFDNCQRCGILRDRHPVPVRSGYGLDDVTQAVRS